MHFFIYIFWGHIDALSSKSYSVQSNCCQSYVRSLFPKRGKRPPLQKDIETGDLFIATQLDNNNKDEDWLYFHPPSSIGIHS